jgi:ribosomal protein L36
MSDNVMTRVWEFFLLSALLIRRDGKVFLLSALLIRRDGEVFH